MLGPWPGVAGIVIIPFGAIPFGIIPFFACVNNIVIILFDTTYVSFHRCAPYLALLHTLQENFF